MQAAVVAPDDGVELAVAVEIGEAGRAAVPHIDAVERIGGAGARDEGRRGGRSVVLEIVQGAEALPDDEVEVAVAIEVGELGVLSRLGVPVCPTWTPSNGLAAPVRAVKAGAMAVPVFSK